MEQSYQSSDEIEQSYYSRVRIEKAYWNTTAREGQARMKIIQEKSFKKVKLFD